MYCRNCGQELSADAKACPGCGEPVPSRNAAENAVVSTRDWFVTMLLACIPLVGIVMMFVWAFGDANLSKKNWARASLIWVGIAALPLILFGSSIIALLANMLY